jgi:CDP-diacylglycerol---glycerol-3-phosphate 3-phosphatidyltransferase
VRTFVARLLVRADVSPNTVTVAGSIGIIVGAIGFAARGQLHTATVIVAITSRCDLLDGEVARIGGRFGALLDSTLDRVADGVILASLTYWLFTTGNDRAAVAALLSLPDNLFPTSERGPKGWG